MMYRRPSRTRSSIGPMNGASTANGAIVMSRVSAIRPRAWSTEVLKNSVPASATATNASAAAPGGGQLDDPVQAGPPGPGGLGQPADDAAGAPGRGRAGPPGRAQPRREAAGRPPRLRPRTGQSHGPSILRSQRGNDPDRPDSVWPVCFLTHSGCVNGGQLLTVSPGRARSKEPDDACAQAVDLARGAAEEMAGPAASASTSASRPMVTGW